MLKQTRLAAELAPHGLLLRGGWVPGPMDALPGLPNGATAAVVWMVGVAGSAFWPHFEASAFFHDGLADALDRWSAHIGKAMALAHGGMALFPFEGPPYYPFQQWADRCEPTQPSPLLLRIHPTYGLWHAYRFALALPELSADDAALLALPTHPPLDTDLCARCSGKPCLQACPVDAFSVGSYHLQACAQHLHADGQGACMQGGCLARHACPHGQAFAYAPPHAAFHMQAFVNNH